MRKDTQMFVAVSDVNLRESGNVRGSTVNLNPRTDNHHTGTIEIFGRCSQKLLALQQV